MNKSAALAMANTTLRIYMEHQQIPTAGTTEFDEKGKKAAAFVAAMHAALVTYFEAVKDE